MKHQRYKRIIHHVFVLNNCIDNVLFMHECTKIFPIIIIPTLRKQTIEKDHMFETKICIIKAHVWPFITRYAVRAYYTCCKTEINVIVIRRKLQRKCT